MERTARVHSLVKGATRNQVRYWLCLDSSKKSHEDVKEIGAAIVASVYMGKACTKGSSDALRFRNAAADAKMAFELLRQLCKRLFRWFAGGVGCLSEF